MSATRLRLFRLRGIPIRVDASWLLILALLTWSLTVQFRVWTPGLDPSAYWLMGLLTALAFFVCIVLHELGHALVAQRIGMSLRGITLFLFGGVAELEGEPPSAGGEFFMAIAGPLVSAVLAAFFWGLGLFGDSAGWNQPVILVMLALGWINLSVLIFNLVPAFPLDGGRVLRSILWAASGDLIRATWWASLLGQGFAWLLLCLGVFQIIYGDFIGGLWFILIGMFLNQAARSSYEQVLTREVLQHEPISRLMNTEPIVVGPSLGLRQWLEDYVYRHHHKSYPVVEDGRLLGFISTDMLARYPRSEWDHHTIAEVMLRDLEAISLPPSADAYHALEQMQRSGWTRLLVTDAGRLVGIVSLRDLLHFLQLKLQLEAGDEHDHGAGELVEQVEQREPAMHR